MYQISYDFHIHSCLSPCGDDDMTPGNIVGMAKLIGLDAIALTDHNTCKNCPSFFHQAQQAGIIPIPGMELNTREEVHVLCLFPSLDEAMRFDSYVEKSILPIPNKPEFFGNQILIDKDDNPLGHYDNLLLSATNISFHEVEALVTSYGGIMIPAHIDKPSTSLLSNLGFVPPESKFKIVELSTLSSVQTLKKQHQYLQCCHFLCNSDAHQLDKLSEAVHSLNVEECSTSGVLKALYNLSFIQE